MDIEQLRRNLRNYIHNRFGSEYRRAVDLCHLREGGGTGNRDEASTGILRDIDEKIDGLIKNPTGLPDNTPGSVEGNCSTEHRILQKRGAMDGEGGADETRQTKRPRRSCRGNQIRRYTPSPVGKPYSDDDQMSPGSSIGVSETESESESCSEHTSDRDFLVAAGHISSGEDYNPMGSPRNRENQLCACFTPNSTTCLSHGRPLAVCDGVTPGNYIRRRIYWPFAKDSSDPHSRPRFRPLNTLPVQDSVDTTKNTQDIHNKRIQGCMHDDRRWCNCKEN